MTVSSRPSVDDCFKKVLKKTRVLRELFGALFFDHLRVDGRLHLIESKTEGEDAASEYFSFCELYVDFINYM